MKFSYHINKWRLKKPNVANLLYKNINSAQRDEKSINLNYNNWQTDVFANWNSKNVDLTISLRVPKFHITFKNCLIQKAKLFSLVEKLTEKRKTL